MAVIIKAMGSCVVLAVAAISFYVCCKGVPFFLKKGMGSMLLKSRWQPLDKVPAYGISHMVGASLLGSFGAMAFAMPIGVVTAVFLTELAPKWLADVLNGMIELLAGLPSIVYGMVGLTVITPFLYKIEVILYKKTGASHIPSGGANLLAAVFVLAIMILPTIVITVKTALLAVSRELLIQGYALGATKLQVISSVMLKSAGSGIMTAGLLALGRVIGETMAVSFVAGGIANLPLPFSSVRFLTTALVGEMGYAVGIHREALFAIGLLLYVLIMILIGGVHGLTAKKYKAG